MSQQRTEAVVRKSVTVARPVDEAFRLYTEGIARWWPLETHSVAEKDADTAVFEAREGGRLYERAKNGQEHLWGTILVWDPPSRIVHTWHPGHGAETAQEVELRFLPDGEGTRVELVHSGWEKLGERMERTMASYESGWDFVLGRFVETANG